MGNSMTSVEVAWYGDVIGTAELGSNGYIEWNGTDAFPGLFDGERHDRPPTFLKNLSPEGWLNDILRAPDRGEYLTSGIRFLSNITIATSTDQLYTAIDLDRVLVPLSAHTKDGTYQGLYNGPAATASREEFEKQLAIHWRSKTMPKFSGIQMKLPVTLYPGDGEGPVLTPAVNSTWSHILKFPGHGFYEPMAALEWMGLEMAERAGLNTSRHALLQTGQGLPPALVVERFDVPYEQSADNKRYLIADFCTVGGINPSEKYGTPAEKTGRIIRNISTDADQDAIALLKRHAFGYFACDYDTHLKNLSMLKTYDPDTGEITNTLAPVYDTLPTLALQPHKGDTKLALPIGGKTGNLNMQNFIQLGNALGLDQAVVAETVSDVGRKVAQAAVALATTPPAVVAENENCRMAFKYAATHIVRQVRDFGLETPEWENVLPGKEQRRELKELLRSRRATDELAFRHSP